MASQSQDVLQRLRGLVTASEPRTVFMLKEMDAPALKQVFLWTQDLAGGAPGTAGLGPPGAPVSEGSPVL